MRSRDIDMNDERDGEGEEPRPRYSAPRIDPQLLTIVVHPSPYSKRTPLGRSRKSTIRRRWFS
jgi:hypothetical protein